MRISKEKLTYEIPEMVVTLFEDVDIVTNSNIDEGGALPINGDYWDGAQNNDYVKF